MTKSEDGGRLSLEIGENSEHSVCQCCNLESNIGHGFVYKDNGAYAIYYAGWTPLHKNKKVSFALSIGEWDEDSTPNDRACFGIDAYESGEEILFKVCEPHESPWSNTELLGKMLPRQMALTHLLLSEVFVIAEYIVRNHPAIHQYLNL